MGGLGKAAWLIFVIAIPWLGVLVYLIAHGRDMTSRDIEQQQAQQQAYDAYIRDAASDGADTADGWSSLQSSATAPRDLRCRVQRPEGEGPGVS